VAVSRNGACGKLYGGIVEPWGILRRKLFHCPPVLIFGVQAQQGMNGFSIAYEQYVGDPSDTDVSGQIPMGVYVHFVHRDALIELPGQILQDGFQQPARAAPIGVEFEQDQSSFRRLYDTAKVVVIAHLGQF
jgi:hypothetical protein